MMFRNVFFFIGKKIFTFQQIKTITLSVTGGDGFREVTTQP